MSKTAIVKVFKKPEKKIKTRLEIETGMKIEQLIEIKT